MSLWIAWRWVLSSRARLSLHPARCLLSGSAVPVAAVPLAWRAQGAGTGPSSGGPGCCFGRRWAPAVPSVTNGRVCARKSGPRGPSRAPASKGAPARGRHRKQGFGANRNRSRCCRDARSPNSVVQQRTNGVWTGRLCPASGRQRITWMLRVLWRKAGGKAFVTPQRPVTGDGLCSAAHALWEGGRWTTWLLVRRVLAVGTYHKPASVCLRHNIVCVVQIELFSLMCLCIIYIFLLYLQDKKLFSHAWANQSLCRQTAFLNSFTPDFFFFK